MNPRHHTGLPKADATARLVSYVSDLWYTICNNCPMSPVNCHFGPGHGALARADRFFTSLLVCKLCRRFAPSDNKTARQINLARH
jgi:hypothetical protein